MDTAVSPVPSISPSQLRALQGSASAPLLLDVRREARFAESPRLLAGAVRCAPEDVARFAATQPAREVVVYCVYGHNVSADATATLLAAGWPAQALAGGIEGGEDGADAPQDIALWRAGPPLTLAKRADLGVTGEQASRWITRERPRIDRTACPWLIRRFIDPRAEFFYVPADRVFSEAARLDAVPYDIPGAPITHEWERCSFDALMQAVDLRDPALDSLAAIVRAADTDRLSTVPQAAGLLSLMLGLSRLHDDDQTMLAAALPVYDALYAWCRGDHTEVHRWTAHAVTEAAQ